MKEVNLFTKGVTTQKGGFVATVLLPQMNPMPEIVVWGSRMFIICPDGDYIEGLCVVAINPIQKG